MTTNKRSIQIRVDPKMYEALKKLSQQERRSVSNLVEVVLEKFFSQKGGEKK